jgi:DNA-binding transcriptional ArsR family regulator
MVLLAELLGSSTRAKVVLALAQNSTKRLSAYRIAKMYGMNVSKVYIEIKRLGNLNLLHVSRGRRGFEYSLADRNLRELANRLSATSRTISYDDWNDPRARAKRLRNGLILIPRFSLERKRDQKKTPLYTKPTRMPGELDNLAKLARKKFDRKYEMTGAREYARI